MTSPDERADNGSRNAAIKTVNDALKAGRIVQADHDMRVSQLKSAQTMQDIDMAVRDLRAGCLVRWLRTDAGRAQVGHKDAASLLAWFADRNMVPEAENA